VPLTSFYKGYKFFDIQSDEIAIGLMIPPVQEAFVSKFFKVSLRKDLDISAVTFAGLFRIEGSTIQEARIALGGVGPTVVRLPDLEKNMQGAQFTENVFKDAGVKARSMIKPISDLRATDQYRLQVTENLFRKCFEELKQELSPCL
jgi:xanthine dehydrogenase small subunit